MILKVLVCLFFIVWMAALNIMDFVDLYEGAKKIFPEVIGGKYSRMGYLRYSSTFMSCFLLMAIIICVYPPCRPWIIYLIEALYIIIYIVLYFVIKSKREERLEKENRIKHLTDYTVMNVTQNSEMKIADKEVYDVLLKNSIGNIITIKTISPHYYEEKMLTGEMVNVSKKDVVYIHEKR